MILEDRIAMPDQLNIKRDAKGRIWSHVRHDWLVGTPEELVRQDYVCTLVNEYDYKPEQMAEELRPPGVRGTSSARADIVIWRTVAEKNDGDKPLLVIECKADNVTIDQTTYIQGGNYANWCKAPFFVAHNHRQTKFYRVDHEKLSPNWTEIKDIPHNGATQKEIEEILASLRTFREDEFADLLHQCHNVIRNREHLDPAAAFDEIAKILFVKTWSERRMRDQGERRNLFTVAVLKQQLSRDPINSLFDQTKEAYRTDKIFEDDERINLRPATVEEIVRRLEAYNLSDTSEDIKGIAFERFLGRTFRGEIGQFFTPRSIVEFMIRMVDPHEGDIICDPASGSGGFLIRFFEIVREQIAADVDRQYKEFAAQVEKKKLSQAKKAELLREKWTALQAQLDPVSDPDRPATHRQRSRIWHLANRAIYGTDANDRMARTSKMNMIMHGDGHGGVHHHNGFLNVNGIFEGRFDIILTNPPFGANVEPSDVVLPEQAHVSPEARDRYRGEYGQAYEEAEARVRKAAEDKTAIAALFDLPAKDRQGRPIGKIKTELLFIERCLDLLTDGGGKKPGGRLGIVLPEGVFNNPSLDHVRQFVEDRAWIRAVISLPQETFTSSGASVKASILFLQKFTPEEQNRYDGTKAKARAETEAKYAPEIERETARLQAEIAKLQCQPERDEVTRLENALQNPTSTPVQRKAARDALKEAKARLNTALAANRNPERDERFRALSRELVEYRRKMKEKISAESRKLLKKRFSYPVFLYDAEHVGISATGDTSAANELYPNPRKPTNTPGTSLEAYRAFTKDPESFFVAGPAA
jgi:type I restriction enzyme M protein